MYVAIRKSGKKRYIYILESFRNVKGQPQTRIIKSLGEYEKLITEDPDIMQKAKELALKLSEEKDSIEKSHKDSLINAFSNVINAGNINAYPSCNIGYTVYKKIWDGLGLDSFFKSVQKKYSKIEFSLRDTVLLMVLSRLVNPSSKLKVCENQKYFIGKFNVDLNHLYRSLDVLELMKIDIERQINRKVSQMYNREVDVVFYDVTTYHFESNTQDKLRDFGFSKANKINEVQVTMRLIIDKEGLPLGYELFPDNTFEGKTLKMALNSLKKKHKIDRVIVTADRGLNSKGNLVDIENMNCDPVHHFNESRIKGHFIMCYIAFAIQRVLEFKLKEAKIDYSTSRIQETIKSVNVTIFGNNAEAIYFKQQITEEKLYNDILKNLDIKDIEVNSLRNEMNAYLKQFKLKL